MDSAAMTPLRRPLLLVAFAATVSAVSVVDNQHKAQAHIEPPLDPKSSKVFFKKDYPDDQKPATRFKLGFNYPYPVVQDSGDFDKDFVKDENGDKGEWSAQMLYDTLRVKVQKEREDVDKALKKEEEQEKELEKMKAAEQEAEAASKDAEAKAAAAKKREDETAAEVERLIGKKAAKDKEEGKDDEEVSGEVGKEVDHVSKEIKDVEGCQKELEEAKKKLAAALEAKKKRDEAYEELYKEKKAAKDAANEDLMKAKDADYDKMADGLRKKVNEEESEYNEADHLVKMSAEEVKKTEAALKKAAERLRKFRHSKTDKNGGVYYTEPEKASAKAAVPALVSLVSALALFSL